MPVVILIITLAPCPEKGNNIVLYITYKFKHIVLIFGKQKSNIILLSIVPDI